MGQRKVSADESISFLATSCSRMSIGKALRCTTGTLEKVASGRAVTPTMAFRVAAMLGIPIDDVLTGRAVSHACPNCGYAAEPTEDAAVVDGPWRGR